MSLRTTTTAEVQLAAVPRVFLLPDEVARSKKAKATRTLLIRVLLLSVLLVAAGVIFAQVQAMGAANQLSAEQARTAALVAEQSKYSEVIATQSSIASIQAAQEAVSTFEVEWLPVIQSVQDSVPADITIVGLTAALPDPLVTETDPLAPESSAAITFTAIGPQESISRWLATLLGVENVVAVAPGSVQLIPDTGLYSVTVAVMFSADVISDRFAPKD